jgi:hypothetical protein
MRQFEPAAQLAGCFIGRTPVKGHQSSGTSGDPGDLGPPLGGANRGNLDVILAAIDDFVESVRVHGARSS